MNSGKWLDSYLASMVIIWKLAYKACLLEELGRAVISEEIPLQISPMLFLSCLVEFRKKSY